MPVNITPKTIQIAAKLYEARDAAKRLYGDKYNEYVAEVGKDLQRLAGELEESILSTALRVAKQAAKAGKHHFQTLVFAATVELLDGGTDLGAADEKEQV